MLSEIQWIILGVVMFLLFVAGWCSLYLIWGASRSVLKTIIIFPLSFISLCIIAAALLYMAGIDTRIIMPLLFRAAFPIV